MSVRVVARIRPLLDRDTELDKDIIVRAESSHEGKPANVVRIPNPKNPAEEFSFTFNGVYDMDTSQETLFTSEVAPHLKALFQGLDVTIFAYGVTGTGKTHTMRGGLKLADRGVIPRLLSGVYRRGKKITKDSEGETVVSVALSYYEIYNDKVFDLFESPEKRSLAGLPLREKDGKTIVVGLSERVCDDLKEFDKLYIEANNNRSTAGTKLNAESSRSHAILRVKVTQTNGDETLISTASAIDLAGSEDNRRTENGKERMVESASINKSLFVLSSCIDAIGRGDKRIPYRESKMTRILSLGQNNGITIMILNLAPLRSYHLDTLSSLNVSSRAKRIEVREIENEVVFKQQPKKSSSSIPGAAMQRQPLRPLANAHNTQVNGVKENVIDKKPKMFSVYSDSRAAPKPSNVSVARTTTSTQKRPSETTASRPTRVVRPNPTSTRPVPGMSASSIEELIERKVNEALANRALEQPAANPPNDISEAVQKRLEALERKLESGETDEAKAEGLRYLLMARQHKERGEDASAMRMYELAVPFFPGQQKLKTKIDNLRAKIQAKKIEFAANISAEVVREPQKSLATAPIRQLPTPPTSFEEDEPAVRPQEPKRKVDTEDNSNAMENEPVVKQRPVKRKAAESDDEFNGSVIMENGEQDDSFSYLPAKPKKLKTKSTKSKSTLKVFADEPETQSSEHTTPRTKHLLDIVNSRDVALIRGLTGVGPKKAKDLVEYLDLQNEDEGGNLVSLAQLVAVPGLGSKTVERAYEGLLIG